MLLSAHLNLPGSGARITPDAMASVWRASELARPRAVTCSTGHDMLDAVMPGKGWPRSSLCEVLTRQSGMGEVQLLQPTLSRLAQQRRIVLVQPPYVPQAAAAQALGINASQLLWLRSQSTADALWAAEKCIRSGNFSAVLFWQSQVRAESLRRLNLAAQGADTWFWMFRPLSASNEASPAPLRLALAPGHGGIEVVILKRLGPPVEHTIFIPLLGMPRDRHHGEEHHAITPEPIPSAVAPSSAAPALV